MVSVQKALTSAVDRHQANDLAEAETLYRRVLDAAPETAAAWHYLGLLFGQSGRLPQCLEALRRACALAPTQIDSYRQTARACEGLGDRRGALAAWRACARSAINDAGAWRGAGVAALASGDGAAATCYILRAFVLEPDRRDLLPALSGLLTEQRQWPATAAAARTWIIVSPDDADAWELAGVATVRLGDAGRGVAAFRRLVLIDPTRADGWANLSRTIRARGDYASALRALHRAVCLNPVEPGALHDLAGLALNLLGAERAAVWAGRTARVAPESTDAAWLSIILGLYCDDVDEQERFARVRRFALRHLKEQDDRPAPSFPNPPDPQRPLRIGYVSADLSGTKPVARNMEPLIRATARRGDQTFLYADVEQPDDTSRRFAAMADGWRSIRGASDEDVARMIREDRIDILVLLAVHFDYNRISLPQFRPAPVLISFHDVATSGLKAMDYLISDRVMSPRRGGERFTERVLRLPHYYLMTPPDDAPPCAPPPVGAAGFITFGCFNNPAKLSDAALDLWGRLLARLPGSRLMLKFINRYAVASGRERILSRLAPFGVSAERILFPDDDALTLRRHLELYNRVDIALDPFPFSGSTTSFEALYMGTPVVTLAQDRMVSRWTASMLDAVGLSDLVAADDDAYIDIALKLAADPPRLEKLSRELRPRIQASPLCDERRKAREVGRLYRAVWRRWCAQTSRSN
jgi:protein O-GlcNAc transferase